MKHKTILAALVLSTSGCASVEIVELSYDHKLARLMKLEDERSLGAGDILSRLSSPEPQMRRRAALALGRIGAVETAPQLAGLLQDPDERVRLTAAFALGLLEGNLPGEALEALKTALTDPSESVRARAIEALGRKGTEAAADAIGAALLERLPAEGAPLVWGEDVESSSVRLPHPELRLGLFALAELHSLRWAWRVLATEEGRARFLWWPAAWASSRFDADAMAPVLLHYAGSNDPYYRVLGAKGLAHLAPELSRTAVVTLLQDPDEKVRIEAIHAAAALGLRQAVPRLLDLLATDAPYVRVEVLKALSKLADPTAVEPLIDRLHDPSPWIRATVLRALAFQDSESFWLLLSGLGSDPDWSARAVLASLLSEIRDPRSVTLLQRMASERDFRVRPHALRALEKVSPQAAVPILLEHLGAEDVFERAAAAEALGHLQPEQAVKPLRDALELSKADKDPGARLAILTALEAYGADVARSAARDLLDDPQWPVRKSAEEILHEMGDTESRAAEVGSGRYLQEYLDLLRPRYTPHAYIRTEKGAIEVELFVVDAPLTVDNFMRLARKGFYNGLTFHRVVPNSWVQGGDPRGDGNGGPGYTIRSEINLRPFLRGTLGMVESRKDTGGSQFFITHLPHPELDGRCTAFGQVVSGMDIVDRLQPGDLIREIVIWDGVTPPGGSLP